MREFSTPLTTEIPATGNLTDDVVTNAREAGIDASPSAAVGGRAGGWEDVTAAEFLAEVSAVAKGLIAAGIEVGDRVALISKTRYEWTLLDYAIWFAGAVTVPIYETSSAEQVALDPRRLRRPRRGRRERRATWPASREVRGELDQLNHVWSITDNAVDTLTRLGGDISDEELEKRRTRGDPARPGDADLHLRHDRAAQGLHAHPRQLHVRARRGRRRAGPALRRPRARPRCSSCRWPTSSRGSSRSAASSRAPGSATRADIKKLLPDLADVQADLHPRGAAGLREGLQHRLAAGHRRRPRQDLRHGRRDRDRLLPRPRERHGPAVAVRAKHAVFDRLVYGKLRDRARRRVRVRRLRRRPARRAARPLLPRHRPHRARGLRPHRDDRGPHRQPARRDQDRHRRPAAARHRRPGGRRRRAAVPRRPGHRRLLAQRGRHRRGPRAATAGSTPATSARSTTRASSGSPAARRRSW